MKLHSIPLDIRYRPVEVGPERDVGTFEVPLRKKKNFFDGIIDLNVGESELRVAHQGPETGDDVARPAPLFDDAHRGLAGFSRFGGIPRKPPDAGFRARDDPGQRLVDLVNDGAGEFAERCEAYGSRKFAPRVRKRLFRRLSLRDVGDDTFQFDVAGRAKVELSHGEDV